MTQSRFVNRIAVQSYAQIEPVLRKMEMQVQAHLKAGRKDEALRLVEEAMRLYPDFPYSKINKQLEIFQMGVRNATAGSKANLYLHREHAPPGESSYVRLDWKALGRHMASALSPRKWTTRSFKPEQNTDELMVEKEAA